MSTHESSSECCKTEPTLSSLADALWDDPFYVAVSFLLMQASRELICAQIVASREGLSAKKAVLMKYLDYSLQEARRTGRTVVSHNGAAIWTLPIEDSSATSADNGNSKAAFMQELLGDDYDSYVKINDFMSAKTNTPHYAKSWYLSILGVDPACQHRGIGRQLLKETLLEVDVVGVDCFLETFDDNKGFYEKFGFQSVEAHYIPHINAEYTIMVRKHVKK